MILFKAIENYAVETPDSVALIPNGQEPVSYMALRNLIWGNMDQLMNICVDSKTRIGCITSDPFEMALWLYSISSLCIAVPMDHNMSESQYNARFELFNLDYILIGKNINPSTMSAIAMARIPILNVKNDPIDSISYPKRSDSETALLLTTSGTTSNPKVVPLTHRNISASAEERNTRYELNENDCFLLPTHLTRPASIHLMFSAHLAGGSAVLMKGFNHIDFFRLYEKYPISWFTAFPAVLESIVEYAKEKQISFPQSTIRFLSSVGAPLPENLKEYLENLFSVKMIKSYGMTETATITSTFGTDTTGKAGSVGVCLGNMIKIHEGEILVKGESVFSGYLDNPEANRDAFIDGWFRTGDLGRIDDDGFVYIIGRIKEMINRGGEKVSPYEVEAYLEKHPLAKQAVVFPKTDENNKEEVAAAIVLERNDPIDASEFRSFLGDYIPAYKIPTTFYITESIPISKNGKFQRKKMSDHFAGFQPLADTVTESVEKLTSTEETVKRHYEKILKKDNIDIHRNFFDMGGDSLSASLLHSELVDAFETDIPVHAFFECPEIGKLAEFIDALDRKKRNMKFVIPLKKSGFKEPLFFVHSLDGDALGYYNIAALLDPDRPVYGIQFKYDNCWKSPLTISQIAEKYIEEIKLVQSSGQYHIAGICMGGQIAYEITQQLSAACDNVSFLAMFDVLVFSSESPSGIPKSNLMKKTVRAIKQFSEIQLSDYGNLFARKAKSLCRTLSTRCVLNVNSNKSFRLKNKRAILTQAIMNSTHKTYDGPVAYFQAKDSSQASKISAGEWSKLIKNIKIIHLDMEHNDFNNPSMSTQMATLLNAELDNAGEK